jgi:hypothetical protein
VHFIENDQFVLMPGEVEFRLRELCAVCIRFEIEIERGSSLPDLQRKRRLADLPRAEQRYGRAFIQQSCKLACDATLNHPCNYGV